MSARARRILHAIPIDLIAFAAIAIAVIATHLSVLGRGMPFNDPAWYFHFGQRALDGDVPYRDYVFQVGPLPIYVDAAFQQVSGGTYRASLHAALAIKILRVFVMWMLARRLAGVPAAAALTAFCALDPVFSHLHHASTAYVHLFVTLAGLLVLLGSRADARREPRYLAAAGLALALVAWARPSVGLMLGAVALALGALLLRRGEYFTRRRMVALWSGYAAGLALLFAALAAAGALGPAIEQMFLDTSRKEAFGLESAESAWLGGAPIDLALTWWGTALASFALPAAVVAGTLYLLARDREVAPRMVAALGIPVGIAYGIQTRYASLNAFSDLPRLLLLAVVVIAVGSPERARRWFGVEPIAAFALAALPLASDWSYPGAAWSETSAHVAGAILILLATTRVAVRTRTLACLMLALAAVVHFVVVKWHHNPFAHPKARDGTVSKNRHAAVVRGERHPLLLRHRITESRAAALGWLGSQIAPGSTCFIHGDLPVLYTLLGCRNPTRVDTTAASLITSGDAAAATEVLRAAPPGHLLVHEQQRLAGEIDLVLSRYDPVATVGEVLGVELAKQAAASWDGIDAVRLYRRKD
jgi:4-amino-4-deoxy-L-arabinose transferase-like glycosyltransferase